VISLEIRGLDQFLANVDASVQYLEDGASELLYKWTVEVFEDLVSNTPQWSSETAGNWMYSVGQPSQAFQPHSMKGVMWPYNESVPPLQRGDLGALWRAQQRMENVPPPRYDEKVFFTNNTPIAPELEAGQLADGRSIRAVNLVQGQVAMASFIAAKWRNMRP
jgi:hypothetical protein